MFEACGTLELGLGSLASAEMLYGCAELGSSPRVTRGVLSLLMPHLSDTLQQDGDWQRLWWLAFTRLRSKLRDFSRQDIEDLSQRVVTEALEFVGRHGPPRSHDGLVSVIAKRRAADAIRRRRKQKKKPHIPIEAVQETLQGPLSSRELDEIREEQDAIAAMICAFFRSTGVHPDCMALAEAKSDGIDFRQYAESAGQSYAAVRQRWTRCLDSLQRAVDAGEVRLGWRLSRKKKT